METITLTINYRTPSLNETKRQHWAEQFREKQKAFDALESALLATASDPSIQTTSPEVSRICSTGYDTLRSYRATNRNASSLRQSKNESRHSKKKKQ